MKIHESHQLEIEPGPYPPGEGPLDYAECLYGCRSFAPPCRNSWPTEGWVAYDEPVPTGRILDDWWQDIPRELYEMECTDCGTALGYTQAEYEGQYGLRLVEVWIETWIHPKCPDVTLCEECSLIVEDGAYEI